MPTIGNPGLFGRGAPIVRAFGLISLPLLHLAQPNDFVDTFYIRASTPDPTATVQAAIYDIFGTLPLWRLHLPITFTINSAVMQTWTVSVPPIALTPGMMYCIAVGGVVGNVDIQGNAGFFDQMSGNFQMPLQLGWWHFGYTRHLLNTWANVINIIPPTTVVHPCCAQIIPP